MCRPHSLALVAAAAGAVAALITAPLAGAEEGDGCDAVASEAVNGGQFSTCTNAGNTQPGGTVDNAARPGCVTPPGDAGVGEFTDCTVTTGDAELVAGPNDSAENAGELQNPFGQSQPINPDEPETG